MSKKSIDHESFFEEELVQEAANMNNFIAFLPGKTYRRIHPKLIPEGVTYGEYLPESEHRWRSQLMLNQTPAEFFVLFDSLMLKHGLVAEQLEDLDQKEVKRRLGPVFIELRKMGYTDYELNV